MANRRTFTTNGELQLTGLSSGTPAANSILALDSGNNVILTAGGGSGGNFTVGSVTLGTTQANITAVTDDFQQTSLSFNSVDDFNQFSNRIGDIVHLRGFASRGASDYVKVRLINEGSGQAIGAEIIEVSQGIIDATGPTTATTGLTASLGSNSVKAGTGLTFDSTGTTANLQNSGVTAGTYINPSRIDVDATGRITVIAEPQQNPIVNAIGFYTLPLAVVTEAQTFDIEYDLDFAVTSLAVVSPVGGNTLHTITGDGNFRRGVHRVSVTISLADWTTIRNNDANNSFILQANGQSSTNRTIVASGAEQTLHDARISFSAGGGITVDDTVITHDTSGQIIETPGDGSFTLNQAPDDRFVVGINPNDAIFEQIPAIHDLK